MSVPFYPSLTDVLGLHAAVMIATGSEPAGLRDEGALDAAVSRPQVAGLYASMDLVEQAALLAVSISQAQAFVDGNKRTAFAAADVFLGENGLRFVGPALALAQWLEAVADERGQGRQRTIAEFTTWLRANVTSVCSHFE